MILIVLMATESPWKDLLIKTSHIVMPDSCSGNKSDIFHHNNKNN